MFNRKTQRQGHRGAVRKKQQQQSVVNRKQIIRALSVFTLLAGIAVLAWQLHDYQPDTVLPIERVAIEGSFKNLAADDMQNRVINVLEGGYFTVNLETIRQALLQMPWVDDVSVRRQWPPALKIRVTEKHAVAYWGDDALLSDKGVLFKPEPLAHDVLLPRLDGPDALHKKVWQFAAEISEQLIALGLTTEKVELDDRRAWQIYASMKSSDARQAHVIEISLGSADVTQRVQRFLKVFAMSNAPDLSDVQVVDMRYPNGFALRAVSASNKQV